MTTNTKRNQYQSIVVLTGAGISAESGLKTFRDNDGLWEGHRVEDVATPEAFAVNPELVHQFYNLRRQQLANEASPNPAHFALTNFAQNFQGSFTLVTQNVDNLHEQAGSKNVLHMHGELLKLRCQNCNNIVDYGKGSEASPHHPVPLAVNSETPCPFCQSQKTLRPDIVWFGEIPMYMDTIEKALSHCDLFVAIGTSGNVYPAAGFVQQAKYYGATCVELNLEPSQVKSQFDECSYGPASSVVPDFFDSLLLS